jgi:hypothetical protein
MTEQPTSQVSSEATAINECKSVEQILKDVIGELNDFEARKLNELKGELEAFVKVKTAAVTEYKNKYEDFKTRWLEEGKQLDQLRSDLLCSYPDWKDRIKSGICSFHKELHELEKDIKSLSSCKGKNEKRRDEAKWQLDAARSTVEAWKTATKVIEEKLKVNQGLITQIRNLSQGEDRAFRLYLLWFKLIPAHNQLRPDDTPASHPEETPETLCGERKEQGQLANPSQEGSSRSQQAYAESKNNPCCESSRKAPWIIDKDKYEKTLNWAFCDYKKKKEEYAQAVSAFQADSDDLVSLTKKLDDKTKSLEDDVKKALGKQSVTQ